MKKEIAKQLNRFADELPIIFEEEPIIIHMTGEDLNLSGYGEYRKFDKKKIYEVPFHNLRAVEHKQQLKDAYKRGGVAAVKEYTTSVKDKL